MNANRHGFSPYRARVRAWGAAVSVGVLMVVSALLFAADHGDTPFLKSVGRHDARVTDLFAFTRGDSLVVVLCVNPAIPTSVTEYQFASDLVFEIFIDNHSEVSPDDPEGIGGTVVEPSKIHEDITIRIGFDKAGHPRVQVSDALADDLQFFAGLRDDPFIRAPRKGRNVAALVLEMPLSSVLADQSTVLVWATSRIKGLETPDGKIADAGGLALRNQFPENLELNFLHPRKHVKETGLEPDVIIFDTSEPAAYPNGRDLPDDVIDLVGDPRPLANDQPFPKKNDVKFLKEFPYLAEPHEP